MHWRACSSAGPRPRRSDGAAAFAGRPRRERDPERPGRSPVPVQGLVAECIYPPTGRMVHAYADGAAGLCNGLFARKWDVHMAAETLESIVNLHAAAQVVNDPMLDKT